MAPPKRRGRNKPPMRIDAALDAMRPMGFDDDTVKKCVGNLLQVYGDDGWIFIEEASYKLLIETLLEGDGEAGPLPVITGGDGASSSAAASGTAKSSSLPLRCDREDVDHRTAGIIDEDDGVHEQNVVSLAEIYDKCKPEQNGSQDDFTQALHELPQPESSNLAPKKKIRKPCYGWISDDNSDDDDNFVSLPPANEAN